MEKIGKSFGYAFRGLKHALFYERNFRLETAMAILVLFLILIFKVETWEAIILILIIGWVLIMELINTVVEMVVNILKPRIHPYARMIKDIMASVVLISSILAVIIGVLIFYPYFRDLFLKRLV